MKISKALTIVLVVAFVATSAWLAYSVMLIQQAGEEGIKPRRSGDALLFQQVEQLAEKPDLQSISQLLPRARAALEVNDRYQERMALAIVLYYGASLEPEQFHANIREALPPLMANYRSANVPRSHTGDLLLKFLAMALLEAPFASWKGDLLIMEPYMREDLDLLEIGMLLESDDAAALRELSAPYFDGENQNRSDRKTAFKIHCMLGEFDEASQYEDAALHSLPLINSSENEPIEPEARPVIDGITYICTIEYLFSNARYEDAASYIEAYRNDLLDPAYVAASLAIISAATGDQDTLKFQEYVQQIVDSPYSDLEPAGAESSIYASLAESSGSAEWLSRSAQLYSGNEHDCELLLNLASMLLLSDSAIIQLKDSNGSTQSYTAIQLASLALENSQNYIQRQHSLMMLCISTAALPDAHANRFRQTEALGYLRSALSSMHSEDEPLPLSARVDLSFVTENRQIKQLRQASPEFDGEIHELIRNYVERLNGYYGEDPLGLAAE
jgi:hypothetical protein